MKKRLQALLISLAMMAGFISPLAAAVPAHASTTQQAACSAANLDIETDAGDLTGCDPAVSCDPKNPGTDNECKVNSLLNDIINIFSLVVGVVAVIMVIVGGLKYITSSGDSSNVNSAKNTILYAVIGLVVVALAQIIVKFVLAKTPG